MGLRDQALSRDGRFLHAIDADSRPPTAGLAR
jgi:hypothetical protein